MIVYDQLNNFLHLIKQTNLFNIHTINYTSFNIVYIVFSDSRSYILLTINDSNFIIKINYSYS